MASEQNRQERGTIRSGNFELGYIVEGSGTPALVIGSSIYYERTFSRELRQRLKLAFVDHRGFAVPQGPVSKADFEFETILADIDLVRRHLGLGKVIIIGHSGHGYMALEYAKRYPKQVSHVVMIATGPSHDGAHMQLAEENWDEAVCPERKAKLEADLALLPGEIEAAPEKRFVTFCLRMAAKSWYDPHFDAAPLWRDVHVNMEAFDHLWGEVFRDLDVARGLEKLEIPVLLMAGRFDYLVAPFWTWQPYRLAFEDFTIKVFDKSSHTPQLEEAGLFDEVLLGWLRE